MGDFKRSVIHLDIQMKREEDSRPTVVGSSVAVLVSLSDGTRTRELAESPQGHLRRLSCLEQVPSPIVR